MINYIHFAKNLLKVTLRSWRVIWMAKSARARGNNFRDRNDNGKRFAASYNFHPIEIDHIQINLMTSRYYLVISTPRLGTRRHIEERPGCTISMTYQMTTVIDFATSGTQRHSQKDIDVPKWQHPQPDRSHLTTKKWQPSILAVTSNCDSVHYMVKSVSRGRISKTRELKPFRKFKLGKLKKWFNTGRIQSKTGKMIRSYSSEFQG